jgi:hypothetical protein
MEKRFTEAAVQMSHSNPNKPGSAASFGGTFSFNCLFYQKREIKGRSLVVLEPNVIA